MLVLVVLLFFVGTSCEGKQVTHAVCGMWRLQDPCYACRQQQLLKVFTSRRVWCYWRYSAAAAAAVAAADVVALFAQLCKFVDTLVRLLLLYRCYARLHPRAKNCRWDLVS
jgi:hypothetical protein